MTTEETLGDLIARLEQISIDPGETDLTRVATVLHERQYLLDRIRNSDTSALDPETRHELVRRIAQVQRRDERLRAALVAACDELGAKLDSMLQARSAARGYRRADTYPAPRRGRPA